MWPDGDQLKSNVDLLKDKKRLQESDWIPLESSHGHFLVTPPSHFALQKAKG